SLLFAYLLIMHATNIIAHAVNITFVVMLMVFKIVELLIKNSSPYMFGSQLKIAYIDYRTVTTTIKAQVARNVNYLKF
ncbi:MAG: hypothetical protein ACJ72F_02300, partial [Nitrososphaeraceae archaeon]